MSYDITLEDSVTKETIILENNHLMPGGTYALGGTKEAWLNITYNYARWYNREDVFPEREEGKYRGIRSIYGMTGAESIPVLKNAISVLENLDEDIDEDTKERCKKQGATGYWMPTRENAIKPLYQLLAFAQLRPDGVWNGD